MSGDWIKVRGALLTSPKVIKMTKILHEHESFREWLTPGGSGGFNGQTVSDAALRHVTLALLTVAWSVAREFGQFVGKDLHLPMLDIADLDGIVGVDGFGESMEEIGWAVKLPNVDAVILPNFLKYNVPRTSAERQASYRKIQAKKRQEVLRAVTQKSQASRDKRVTREEKSIKTKRRREERNTKERREEAPARPSGLVVPQDEARVSGELCQIAKSPQTPENAPGATQAQVNAKSRAKPSASLLDPKEPAIDWEKQLRSWNFIATEAGLKKAKGITGQRLARLQAQFQRHGGPEAFWKSVWAACQDLSNFARQQGFVTLDFVSYEGRCTRLLEGNYKRGARDAAENARGRTSSFNLPGKFEGR